MTPDLLQWKISMHSCSSDEFADNRNLDLGLEPLQTFFTKENKLTAWQLPSGMFPPNHLARAVNFLSNCFNTFSQTSNDTQIPFQTVSR